MLYVSCVMQEFAPRLRIYPYNLYNRINICIKKIIQSHFTCVFIGEMQLDNFLYTNVYAIMQVDVDISLRLKKRPIIDPNLHCM